MADNTDDSTEDMGMTSEDKFFELLQLVKNEYEEKETCVGSDEKYSTIIQPSKNEESTMDTGVPSKDKILSVLHSNLNEVREKETGVSSTDTANETGVSSDDIANETGVTFDDTANETGVSSTDTANETSVTFDDTANKTGVSFDNTAMETTVSSEDSVMETTVSSDDNEMETTLSSGDRSKEKDVSNDTKKVPQLKTKKITPVSVQKGKLVEQKRISMSAVVLKVQQRKRKLSKNIKTIISKKICFKDDDDEDPTSSDEDDEDKGEKIVKIMEEKLKNVDSLLYQFQDFMEVNFEETIDEEESVKFSKIKTCTICGNVMVADSNGHVYTRGVKRQNETFWWCAFRDAAIRCRASALQEGNSFQLRSTPHCHDPKRGRKTKWRIGNDQCCENSGRERFEPTVTLLELDDDIDLQDSEDDEEEEIYVKRPKFRRTSDIRPVEMKIRKHRHDNVEGFLPASEFGILEGIHSSSHGKPKLVDGKGFSYTIKKDAGDYKIWRCSVRNKNICCRVFIFQKGSLFKYNENKHEHVPRPLPDPHRIRKKKSRSRKERMWAFTPSLIKKEQVTDVTVSCSKPQDVSDEKTVVPASPVASLIEPVTVGADKFTILQTGSIKGKRLLVDEKGYTYTVRRDTNVSTYWLCSVRNRRVHCRATVLQAGQFFTYGPREHLHAPRPPRKMNKKKRRRGEGIKREPVEYIEPNVSFRIITDATRFGRSKLIDSDGFSYSIRRTNGEDTYWKCIVRNRKVTCKAAVMQHGDVFLVKKETHCHETSLKLNMLSKASANDGSESPGQFVLPGENVTYQTAEKILRKGRTKSVLMGSDGYFYNPKRHREGYFYWLCSEANKTHKCSASVIQRGDKYRFGKKLHCHDPPAIEWMPDETEEDPRNCSSFKVIEAIAKCLDLDNQADDNQGTVETSTHFIFESITGPQSFTQTDEVDSRIKISTEFIPPNFLQKDIYIDDGERHLVLSLKEQMHLLSQAKVWYIDTTTKNVCIPFEQTLTIQAYVHSYEGVKHVPLAFVLMSRSQKIDYQQVFQVMLSDMPQDIGVEILVAPVDVTIWDALKTVFPNKMIRGCGYHWGRAIWKKVVELQLKADYTAGSGAYGFINKVLALMFLPQDHLPAAFRSLWEIACGHKNLEALLDFIDNTWITSPIWNLTSWSMFMQAPRQRTDIENWYIQMSVADLKPTFCRFLWHLMKVSKQVPYPGEVIHGKKLFSFLKSNTGSVPSNIIELYSNYTSGNYVTDVFLQTIGLIISKEVNFS